MHKIKLLLATVLFVLIFKGVFAQQDNTLYFMKNIPQSNLANPANGCDCKVNVYGIVIPVLGQLPPPMSLNLGNTGFTLKHAFKQGGNFTVGVDTNLSYPPQVVSVGDSLVPDFDYLFNAMAPVNYITADLQIHLLGGGFKIQDWYLTFGITEKINFSLAYPKDLFGLVWKGNGGYLDQPADLSGLGINFTHYREFFIGGQRKITDKLKVGANVKWLFGKSNIYTRKSEMKLFTDPTTFDMKFQSNMEINMNLPDPILMQFIDGNGKLRDSKLNIFNKDSLALNDSTGNFSPSGILNSNYFLNRGNFGMALDLGAIYQLNDKIELSASIIDLGFIHWKSNPFTLKSSGDFTFQGVDFTTLAHASYIDKNDSTRHKTDSVITAFTDSLLGTMSVSGNNSGYNSYLSTKIYIGGTYQINEKINVGLLTRTEIYQRSIHPSLTFSCNTNFFKWLTVSGSYSFINRYYMNLGLGFGIKAAFMQFYIVSDNLFGIRPEMSTSIPMPYNTRDMNIRFGCNMVFGCQKPVITKSFL